MAPKLSIEFDAPLVGWQGDYCKERLAFPGVSAFISIRNNFQIDF